MEPQKRRRGCLFWGGIIAAVLFLFVLLGFYGAYRYAIGKLNEYTDTQPMELPTVQLSDQEKSRLQERIANFNRTVNEGGAVEPLVLTADEANAWIAMNPNFKVLQGRSYVQFEGDQIKAQVSIPVEELGIRIVRGRYLNGSGTFEVALRGGTLEVNAQSLTVKGKEVPEEYMRQIRLQNFAAGFTNNAGFNSAVSKLKDVQVRDGKLIITPK